MIQWFGDVVMIIIIWSSAWLENILTFNDNLCQNRIEFEWNGNEIPFGVWFWFENHLFKA